MINCKRAVAANTMASLLISAAMLLVQGCASKPAEIAPQATEALNSLRSELLVAKTQVQDAANAANDLLKQPRADLASQIQRVNSSVATLNATREQARTEAQAQQRKTDEYFARWDAQLATMSQETAERGKQRLAMAKKSIDRLRTDAAAIRSKLNPFMSEMNEAARYLSTDTTKSGVDVVRPKLQSAIKREPDISRLIDKMIADIDAIRAGR